MNNRLESTNIFQKHHLPLLPWAVIVNIICLTAAGLFTTIWPLSHINDIGFPSSCTEKGFILATLPGFVHLLFAAFLIIWLVINGFELVSSAPSLWYLSTFVHSFLTIIFSIVGMIALFTMMDDYCIDSRAAKWGLFVVYLLFMLSSLGTWGLSEALKDSSTRYLICITFPIAQLFSPWLIFVSIFKPLLRLECISNCVYDD